MWLDPSFWGHYFQSIFAPQITVYCDSILDRVLPIFNNIADEADKVADREYERLGHLHATDDHVDMAVFAESAHDAGLIYFELMSGTWQGLVNLATAGLYHLLEQQLLLILRRQVLDPHEENGIRLFELKVLEKRLADGDIHLENLPSWTKIIELGLVANAIKHGEGRSAVELRKIRQDLFVHPTLRDDNFFKDSFRHPIDMPLGGEGIFVQAEDFQEYKRAVLTFWHEFSELIMAKGAG